MSQAIKPDAKNARIPEFKGAHAAQVRGVGVLLGDLLAFPIAWLLSVTLAAMAGKAELQWLLPPGSPAGIAGILFSAGAILTILAFAAKGQYLRRNPFWEEMRVVWRFLIIFALLNFSLSFFIQVSRLRIVIALAWLLTLALVPLLRVASRELLHRMNRWQLPALVVGEGSLMEGASEAIAHEPHLGLRVIETTSATDADAVVALARSRACQTVVLALGPEPPELVQPHAQLVDMLQAERLEVFVVPAISGLPVQGIQAQHFLSSDTLMLRLQGSLFDPRSQHLKRGLDILLSILALLACAPILAWAAWCVWREDGSPVIYTTRRIGSGGREFDFIKFRSMVKNADAVLEAWKLEKPLLYAEFQENFKLADDPRVLKCGKWLRRLSIDELPQLWNVLRGDMSMVGPRPFPQRELSRLPPDAIVLYKQVRPGITGLWQVSGRSDTTFDRRMELNNWYVRNWSLWLDWVVLLKTVRVVLSSRGAV